MSNFTLWQAPISYTPEQQYPIANTDIKDSLKIDSDKNGQISLEKACCDIEATALELID